MAEKNVFITGGSRGLGRDTAFEFAKAGYGVGFCFVSNQEKADETLAKLKELNPDKPHRHWQLDVSKSADVEKVVDEAIDHFEDLPCVVNNAGINRNNAAAMMSDEEWHEVIGVNLNGPFYVIRQFIMHMLSMRFGRFVNISSLAHDGSTGQANYSASKGGLGALSRCIAKEYGPKGITSNIIIPGVFRTDMTEENLSPFIHDFWMTFCPAKRLGEGSELGRAAVFLCSEEAAFINGNTTHLTGGLTYSP